LQAFDATSGTFLSRFAGKGDENHQLDKPEGIAVDLEGNVFVADYSSGFIKKYDSTYAWIESFSEYGTGPGQNMKSEFMDIRDGRLYLPEAGNHRIDVFDLSGRFLNSTSAASARLPESSTIPRPQRSAATAILRH